MTEPITFRFLDLPKELRFMVYEHLTVSTKQHRFTPLKDGFLVKPPKSELSHTRLAITLTLQTLPVQIFSTCQLVYSEAFPFLNRKLDKIRETIPRMIVDADCLYTSAFDTTQKLFCALLNNINDHPFFSPKPTTLRSLPQERKPPQWPKEIQQWLAQTTHLLLSQRPPPCPFAGFMGTRIYPTVRLIIEVPKVWEYSTYRALGVESPSTPPLYTGSVTSQLSQLYSELIEHTRDLKHIKSGAIVFGQGDERVVVKEGLVVWKSVALDFEICRVVE
ncbi:hypothetical protein E8E13_002818 [Curvularia kusanoi]|uniref:F-box domain-containing protein n=1 Tax=Curvularia kusanoi TaxID=90978 RepID=A0A9P4W4V5_CURKU|nr:hypothetical protein E8E13_002818 [Curvularia kusanoi]